MPGVADFDEKSRCLLEKALNPTSTDARDDGSRQAFIEYLDHKWQGPGWIPQDVREAATGKQKDFPCKGICEAMFGITELAVAEGAVLEILWKDKRLLRRDLLRENKKLYQKRSLKLTERIASELLGEMKVWSSSRWERAKAVKCVGTQPGPDDEAMQDGSHPEIRPENSPQTGQPDTPSPATPCVSKGLTPSVFQNSDDQAPELPRPILEEVLLPDSSACQSPPVFPTLDLGFAQVGASTASPAARVWEIVKAALRQQNESIKAAEQQSPMASASSSAGVPKLGAGDTLSSPQQPGTPAPKRATDVIDLTDQLDDTPSSKRLRGFSLPAETVKAALEDPGKLVDDETITLLCSAVQILYAGDRLIRVFPLQRMNRTVTAKFKKDLKDHLEASGDVFLISNPVCHWALVALSQISEDVCKAAYHDSMYNPGNAEEAKKEIEVWMRLVGIEKGIDFEVQVGAILNDPGG